VNAWLAAPAGTAIYCSNLVVAVKAGALTTGKPRVTPNTSLWRVSGTEIVPGTGFGLGPKDASVFYLDCPSEAAWLIDYDLQVEMAVDAVAPPPGSFDYAVVETSGESKNNFQQRRSTFTIGKAPWTPYLDNLIATSADESSARVPRGRFASSEKVRLQWNSNGAAFALYAGDNPKPVWSGRDTAVILDPLPVPTTFTLKATPPPGAGDGVLSATLTVVVSNPALTPRTVADAGSLTATGASALAGTTLNAVNVGGTLAVAGATGLAGNATASVLTVNGASSLQGAASLASASASSLGVGGQATLGSATAATLAVTQKLAVLNSQVVKANTGFTAGTDGLLFGIVGGGANVSSRCVTWIWGSSSGGITMNATGGNVCQWMKGKDDYAMAPHPGAFMLPVARGQSVYAGMKEGKDQQTTAPTSFTWFPFGTGTIELLTDEQIEALGLAREPPLATAKAWHDPPGPRAAGVVDALGPVFGDDLADPIRSKIADVLARLARHES
jgi:hypothetical protein